MDKPINTVDIDNIDWTGRSDNTLRCRCGQEWRSPSKLLMTNYPTIISKTPCPKCGKRDNIEASYGDRHST